jgi:hypothetical protein
MSLSLSPFKKLLHFSPLPPVDWSAKTSQVQAERKKIVYLVGFIKIIFGIHTPYCLIRAIIS